jgi:capsular polysaccharide biosynthesis protein
VKTASCEAKSAVGLKVVDPEAVAARRNQTELHPVRPPVVVGSPGSGVAAMLFPAAFP